MPKRFLARSLRSPFSVATLVAVAAVGFCARALDPAHLDQLPTVEQVLAEQQGANALDTKARQVAALHQWERVVGFLAGDREFCCQTADEQRLIGSYRDAASAIETEMRNTLSTAEPSNPFKRSEYLQWSTRRSTYERDAELRTQSFAKHLKPDALARLGVAYREFDARMSGESPPSISQVDEGTRAALTVALNVAMALMLLVVVREFLPFGSRRSNPLKIGAGLRLYTARWSSGVVTDYKTWTETVHTKVSDVDQHGVHRNVRFYSHTYVHESFKLVGGDAPHEVHVVDANLNVPDGHFATAVWASRRFKKTGGDYILFFDRTAKTTKPMPFGTAKMFAVRGWIFAPLLFGAFVLGGMGLPRVFPDALHNINDLLVGLLSAFAMGVAALGWIAWRTIPKRTRRFVKRDAPRILAAIEKQEPASAGFATPAT